MEISRKWRVWDTFWSWSIQFTDGLNMGIWEVRSILFLLGAKILYVLSFFPLSSPSTPLLYLFYFFGHTSQYVGSWFLNQGSNPCPLQWKHWVLIPCTVREFPPLLLSSFFLFLFVWGEYINIFFVDMLNLRYTVETQLYGSISLEFAFGIYIWNYQQLDGI